MSGFTLTSIKSQTPSAVDSIESRRSTVDINTLTRQRSLRNSRPYSVTQYATGDCSVARRLGGFNLSASATSSLVVERAAEIRPDTQFSITRIRMRAVQRIEFTRGSQSARADRGGWIVRPAAQHRSLPRRRRRAEGVRRSRSAQVRFRHFGASNHATLAGQQTRPT